MNNYQIADAFTMLSKLMDIHGENSFKSKSYASAAFTIEKLSSQLEEMPKEKIAGLKGIGASSAQKIIELLETGQIKILNDIIFSTPPGVIEMLNIKGIGPKKINTIWKEMELESIGELIYACRENRLKLYKGFGEKTQQNVIDVIEFYLQNKGSHLYASVEKLVPEIMNFLQDLFPEISVQITGEFARQLPVINEVAFTIETGIGNIKTSLASYEGFLLKEEQEESLLYTNGSGINLRLYESLGVNAADIILKSSSSDEFYQAVNKLHSSKGFSSEYEYFLSLGLPYISPALRETAEILQIARESGLPELIQAGDIKGIIHAHSNWSDGSNTLEEMAAGAMDRGMEYLVISDHSKSAFYAQGLNEEKILHQHSLIDELNQKLAPFKIFKSIESDILNDGSLDYNNAVLASFDLVIASVHSNLKMTEEKAMARLLKAIENPYTTILGHMTGRLLLSREGYPLNHFKIIDACAACNVVIELNANPNRLDMDWKYINYALKKNVLISIDPDAHSVKGMDDTRFAVLVAQKAGMTKGQNLSSFNLAMFEQFLASIKK